MVRLCLAGGRLTQELETAARPGARQEEAERLHAKLGEAARLHAKGDIAGASALYHEILKTSPREPTALHMTGIIAQQAGNPELALKFFEMALAANPDFTAAWYNRGLVLHALKRDREALQSVQAAVELDPDLGDAWDMIGQLLKTEEAYDQARGCHARAIALQPKNVRFLDNYAALLLAMDDGEGAYLAARKALEIDASYLSMSLGGALKAMGYPERAIDHFSRIRSSFASDADIAATEAMARLQIGDFEQGWPLWEQRPCFAGSLDAISLWQGQKIDHLFLYEDQGLGDALQYLRYIPLLREHAAHLVLCVRGPLRRLCKENFPALEIIAEDQPAPDAPPSSARYRLTSLPSFFSARMDNIPAAPYLGASSDSRAFWRDALRDFPAPRIGLVWAGGKGFKNDSARSLNFDALQPVIACGAAHFVSLQKDRPDKIDAIFDAAPRLQDFADTAALVAELDLVLTVDTATAHLAGALGKPVWILLPFDSDWRWFIGREDSPWYATARLFRQKRPGDWAEVIDRIKNEVRKLIAGDRTVLQATPWDGCILRQNPNALPLPL